MILNFFEHIQQQLDSIVNDLFFTYGPDELTEPLNNTLYWWDDDVYRKIKLHVDHAEMTFVGWMNAVEIMGLDVERFNVDLIEAIHCTIEYQWDIRRREAQEDYIRELEVAV